MADRQDRQQFQTSRVAGIALVHFVHDIYTSFLSPLLPLLIKKMSLSLSQAGSLALFMQAPSILNPFLGALADRRRLNRILLTLAPGMTAAAMCLVGLAPTYGVLAAILLVAGISVAAMHVSGPVIIARLSGGAVGRGAGLFMVGGELARTLGPLLTVSLVSALTLDGLWQVMPVGLAASAVLYWKLPRRNRSGKKREGASLTAMLRSMRGIIPVVLGVLLARSFMAAAVTTFLPTYLYNSGTSLLLAGGALSVFERPPGPAQSAGRSLRGSSARDARPGLSDRGRVRGRTVAPGLHPPGQRPGANGRNAGKRW